MSKRIKQRYGKGLKKRCDCAWRTWDTCTHPWFFNFTWKGQAERGSLEVSSREDAIKKFAGIKAAIMNGTHLRTKPQPAAAPRTDRPAFEMVAAAYAKDTEGLVKLAASSRRQHGYDVAFLRTVIIPPGVVFTDKPFVDFIRADIKLAIQAKGTATEKTYQKNGRTWMRTVGGKVAANRLHDHLRSLWNWAIEEGYATTSPFIRTRKGKNRLKDQEFPRDRRLREGEEAGLLQHANRHLRDVIVAALETGMRKGEILSLTWSQVRWMQNEIHLPGRQTKSRCDRTMPISPTLREILTRRQYGMTSGPNPQQFKFKPEHFVFGDEAGGRISDVGTAWDNAVLKAHGVRPERTRRGGALAVACRAKLAEIDLHFHDLRHEAGSRKLEAGWPLHAVSAFLGHANITTTARYLNVKDDYLQDLIERKPLALVRG